MGKFGRLVKSTFGIKKLGGPTSFATRTAAPAGPIDAPTPAPPVDTRLVPETGPPASPRPAPVPTPRALPAEASEPARIDRAPLVRRSADVSPDSDPLPSRDEPIPEFVQPFEDLPPPRDPRAPSNPRGESARAFPILRGVHRSTFRRHRLLRRRRHRHRRGRGERDRVGSKPVPRRPGRRRSTRGGSTGSRRRALRRLRLRRRETGTGTAPHRLCLPDVRPDGDALGVSSLGVSSLVASYPFAPEDPADRDPGSGRGDVASRGDDAAVAREGRSGAFGDGEETRDAPRGRASS